jgi:hypothetical protein
VKLEDNISNVLKKGANFKLKCIKNTPEQTKRDYCG